MPGISRVAVLSNPTIPAQALELREAKVAAGRLKLQLQLLEARAPSDFADAFAAMTKERADGFFILTSSMFYAERARIAELAAQSRLPAIFGVKEFADGGLMTYGRLTKPPTRRSLRLLNVRKHERRLKGVRR